MSEHEQIRKNLVRLIAGTLTAEEEAALRAHLAACPACAHEAQVWQRLRGTLERIPETLPTPARLARIKALAVAHREEVLERRWNRLVLTGLVLYGWALFVVVWPLLPALIDWLGTQLSLPWFVVVIAGLGLWWSFCWVIGLALLPLLRKAEKVDLEEKVV